VQQDGQVAVVADEGSASVLAIHESNLTALLALPFGSFMHELHESADLHVFIETFLRFARRWFDPASFALTHDNNNNNDNAASPLARSRANVLRNVFVVLLRVVADAPMDKEERAKHFPDGNALARKLKGTCLLSGCHLMDICALYGQHNPRLVRRLVKQSLRLMPHVTDELAAGINQVADLLFRVTDDIAAHARQQQSKELEDMTQVRKRTVR
jgi:hypothetical protein